MIFDHKDTSFSVTSVPSTTYTTTYTTTSTSNKARPKEAETTDQNRMEETGQRTANEQDRKNADWYSYEAIVEISSQKFTTTFSFIKCLINLLEFQKKTTSQRKNLWKEYAQDDQSLLSVVPW